MQAFFHHFCQVISHTHTGVEGNRCSDVLPYYKRAKDKKKVHTKSYVRYGQREHANKPLKILIMQNCHFQNTLLDYMSDSSDRFVLHSYRRAASHQLLNAVNRHGDRYDTIHEITSQNESFSDSSHSYACAVGLHTLYKTTAEPNIAWLCVYPHEETWGRWCVRLLQRVPRTLGEMILLQH